jgi:hypothetical protein
MLYRFFARILRRHMFLHLVIPVVAGLVVEVLYSCSIQNEGWRTCWEKLPAHLRDGPRIALLAGIFLAYLLIIMIQIRQQTNIGLQQEHLYELTENLKGAKSLFAVGTIHFSEWFDPAVQVYLATIGEQKLRHVPPNAPFKYERVLLLAGRGAMKDLASDYIDGHYARCLVEIHKRLHTALYFLEWPEIYRVLEQLDKNDKIHIGYYPSFMKIQWVSDNLARRLIWLVRRRRVRYTAVGLIEPAHSHSNKLAFQYSKHAAIVEVHFVKKEEYRRSWERFVDLIKVELFDPKTKKVHFGNDFIGYFGGHESTSEKATSGHDNHL